MKFYHGSKKNFELIEKRQAGKADDIEVPENELLNAIYVTPNYEDALAFGIRPLGVSRINNEEKTIEFRDHPELFDPEEEVFVYEFNSDDVPSENIKPLGDGIQWIITSTEKMLFSNKFKHKAGDVRKYFKLINWDEQEYYESKKREERLNELRNNEKESNELMEQEQKSRESINQKEKPLEQEEKLQEQEMKPVETKSEFNMR